MKKLLSMLLTAALCLSLGAAAWAEKPASWDLIEKIVVLYGAQGEAAADRIVELLGELQTLDAAAADKWAKILNSALSPWVSS